VFQRYNLLPALTALDNVLAPVLPIRVEFDKTARARELLAAVGLADRERSLPGRMSGGRPPKAADRPLPALDQRPTKQTAESTPGATTSPPATPTRCHPH